MEHQAARHHPTKENKIEKASDRISSIKKKRKLPENFGHTLSLPFLQSFFSCPVLPFAGSHA